MKITIDQALQKGIEAHKAGKLQEAERFYTGIIKANPKHPDANHNFGVLAVGVGKIQEALPFFKIALGESPTTNQYWRSYVEALIKLDKLDDARNLFLEAKSHGVFWDGFNALEEKLFLSGSNQIKTNDISQQESEILISYYKNGNYQEGLNKASNLLLEFPYSITLLNIIGGFYQGLGKQEEALDTYKNVLSLNPDYAPAHYNKAKALNAQGKITSAVAAYKDALSINPNFGQAHLNLGNIYLNQGKFLEAKKAYDNVTSPYAAAKALECLYALNNREEFNNRVSSLANIDPNNIDVAAISAFASHQFKQDNIYPFCKTPLDMVRIKNLRSSLPNFDDFMKSLLAEMNEVNASWEPEGQTTKGGFQTSNSLLSNTSPNLTVLENTIKQELHSYKSNFASYNDLIIKNWPDEIKLNAWYVRLLAGGHQKSHIHASGWVSGVFYLKTVQVPKNQEGAIKFGLHGYNYPIKDKNYPTKLYQPENGDLVLFPSSLFHETIPVTQEVERCVIAFDLAKVI